jgi:hypothetical protein
MCTESGHIFLFAAKCGQVFYSISFSAGDLHRVDMFNVGCGF